MARWCRWRTAVGARCARWPSARWCPGRRRRRSAARTSPISPPGRGGHLHPWPRARSIAGAWKRRAAWLGWSMVPSGRQAFLDAHRPDAVRMLDFPHAAEWVSGGGGGECGERAENAGAGWRRARTLERGPMAGAGGNPAQWAMAPSQGVAEERTGAGRRAALPGNRAPPDDLRPLPRSGLAHRQWHRRERQQARRRGALKGAGLRWAGPISIRCWRCGRGLFPPLGRSVDGHRPRAAAPASRRPDSGQALPPVALVASVAAPRRQPRQPAIAAVPREGAAAHRQRATPPPRTLQALRCWIPSRNPKTLKRTPF